MCRCYFGKSNKTGNFIRVIWWLLPMTVNSPTPTPSPLAPQPLPETSGYRTFRSCWVIPSISGQLWPGSKFPIRLNSVSPGAVFPAVLTRLPTSHGHQAPLPAPGDPGDGMWPLDKKDLEMGSLCRLPSESFGESRPLQTLGLLSCITGLRHPCPIGLL